KVGWLVGRSPKADPTATEVQHHAADNRFDYGICGGLGFELHPNRNAFFVEARFYMGLSDLYDNSKTSYFGSSGNINFTFKLGWLFNVNK
ncbi:MAG: PorT family protein, partial [Paludibacteraceae bacterium]|nr:PorT family protein [Paludibacteraceae bacterium]